MINSIVSSFLLQWFSFQFTIKSYMNFWVLLWQITTNVLNVVIIYCVIILETASLTAHKSTCHSPGFERQNPLFCLFRHLFSIRILCLQSTWLQCPFPYHISRFLFQVLLGVPFECIAVITSAPHRSPRRIYPCQDPFCPSVQSYSLDKILYL